MEWIAFFNVYFIILWVWVFSLHVYMCNLCAWFPWMSDELELSYSYELPCGCWGQTPAICKSSRALNHWVSSPVQWVAMTLLLTITVIERLGRWKCLIWIVPLGKAILWIYHLCFLETKLLKCFFQSRVFLL